MAATSVSPGRSKRGYRIWQAYKLWHYTGNQNVHVLRHIRHINLIGGLHVTRAKSLQFEDHHKNQMDLRLSLLNLPARFDYCSCKSFPKIAKQAL